MKDDRLRIIKQIEKIRGTYVICYITSTRQNATSMMSMDAPRVIFEHLKVLGDRSGRIDLFLHSDGGDTTVPWRLVTLLREFCKELCVIVPHHAFSAATLTALGADKIIMHPMGMLGPTDPTVNGPFNPQNPRNQNELLGINVEDVTAFISLIREDAGVEHEEEFVQAFNRLTDKVHPLALGNVKRFLSQSRMMAKKLLSLHMLPTEQHTIDGIVDNLTSKLFFHGHPINRREARELGLTKVEDASTELEPLIWSLYEEYEKELSMNKALLFALDFAKQLPTLPAVVAPVQVQVGPETTSNSVYIESINRTDLYRAVYEVAGAKQPNGTVSSNLIVKEEGWIQE